MFLDIEKLTWMAGRKLLALSGRMRTEEDGEKLLYLDGSASNPAKAFEQAGQEIVRLGEAGLEALKKAAEGIASADLEKERLGLEQVALSAYLEREIPVALGKLRGIGMTARELGKLGQMLAAAADGGRIGFFADDILEGLLELKKSGEKFADGERDSLIQLAAETIRLTEQAIDVYRSEAYDRLGLIQTMEAQMEEIRNQAVERYIRRFSEETAEPSSLWMQMVSDLSRCAEHAVRFAFSIARDGND